MLKDRIQFKDEETESVKELLNDSNGKYQSMQQYVSHCKDELHKAQQDKITTKMFNIYKFDSFDPQIDQS